MSIPEAVFRPRRGRWLGWGFAAASLLVFGGLSLLMLGTGFTGWGLFDSALMCGFGFGVSWMMLRFATVYAVPSDTGLKVRNLLLSREVTWAELERIRFQDGDPWVCLELRAGDELPIMAIQRAEGAQAQAELARLQTLFAAQSR